MFYPPTSSSWDLLKRHKSHQRAHLPGPRETHRNESLGSGSRGRLFRCLVCQSKAESCSSKSLSTLWSVRCCWMMNWKWQYSSAEVSCKKSCWIFISFLRTKLRHGRAAVVCWLLLLAQPRPEMFSIWLSQWFLPLFLAVTHFWPYVTFSFDDVMSQWWVSQSRQVPQKESGRKR